MITYDELMKIISEYQSNDAYDVVLLSKPWDDDNLDSIIDFVRRWNKRVPIGKNKDKIKKVVLNLRKEFDVFKNCCIENFNFTQENTKLVKSIFDTLSETALKSIGTAKLMHGINPHLFVMWDKGICGHYGVCPNTTAQSKLKNSCGLCR